MFVTVTGTWVISSMQTSASLVSPRLQFARGDAILLLRDSAEVVHLDSGARHALPIGHADAITGFADQIWVASGGELHTFAHDGQRIRAAHRLPTAPDAQLVAAPVGGAAALWTARSKLVLIEDGAELRELPIPDEGLVMPMTGRRWVTAHRAQIRAPSGIRSELPPASRVTAGAVIFDGTAALLVVDRPDAHELVMIGLSHGRVVLRRPMPAGAAVRVAVRRGIAVIELAPDRCDVVDLRAGRSLGELRMPHAIADLAIDGAGEAVAVETSAGLEVCDLRELLMRAAAPVEHVEPSPVVPAADVAAPSRAPEPVPVPSEEPARIPEHRPLDLRTFVPVPKSSSVPRALALAILDHDMRTVALWALKAIAHAWDTRSLGYGNEGKHPYELEVAALLGMNRGFAGEYVEAARDHLARHEQTNPPHPRTVDTPLGLLAAELGLSELEIDVLLVIAAPALWGEAARLYGILANDPSRPLVDEQLVLQILAQRANRHDIAAALDPRASLVRLGVVGFTGGAARQFAGLAIDPVVLARLRCEAPDLGIGLSVRTSDRALEELTLAVGVIGSVAAGLAAAQGPLRIALTGRPGSGRRALLAALAAEAGRPLAVIDAQQLPRTEREFAGALASALRTAHLAGLLPCVIGIDELTFGERTARDAASELLRAHAGPLAVLQSTGAAALLPAGHIAVELPVLEEGERLAVWRRSLADARLAVADVAALASAFRVGPGTIHRAVSAAADARGAAPDDATPALRAYMRQTRDARLGSYARRVERLAGWDTLVLPSDVLDSLRELVSRVRHRRTVFETWGMDRLMATSRGLTALFQGPPGTGKTMVAGVIARELGMDLYQVDLSKVMSKWIGETERNLAAIFDAAEDGQVILLFDEADSLFAKRTEVKSSNDRYANLEVNYLLQRLDAFEGMAILTTNNGGSVDPAFKRRLSYRLSFPFPDEDTRTELWRAHLPARLPIAGELALDHIAHKYQLSGGYIRNACLRAAFLAAADGGALTQHHLERAVALEFAELGKLSTGGTLD